MAAVLLAPLAGCGAEEAAYEPTFTGGGEAGAAEYAFAVLPLHSPQLLDQIYGPLVEYVNARMTGAKLRLVTSRGYAAYSERIKAEEFDFALANPYQALQALDHGYALFGKMGDDRQFRGIILVRRDAGIETVADLRGKTISYPAPTAVAGTMMPQYFLHARGAGLAETTTRYVGSQEASIMSVYLGSSDAAATWPPPWELYAKQHPAAAAELEVKWETEPLVNNGLVVHRRVPAAVTEQLGRILFSLHESEEGRKLLAGMTTSRFDPATEETYRPVKDFLKTFEATVRAAEAPGKG